MTTKKKSTAIISYPQDACGACKFCRINKDIKGEYLCWGMEPFPIYYEPEEADDVPYIWVRGARVEIADPACHLFALRMND